MKNSLLLSAILVAALCPGGFSEILHPDIQKLIELGSMSTAAKISLVTRLTAIAINSDVEGTPEYELAQCIMKNGPLLVGKLLKQPTVMNLSSTASGFPDYDIEYKKKKQKKKEPMCPVDHAEWIRHSCNWKLKILDEQGR